MESKTEASSTFNQPEEVKEMGSNFNFDPEVDETVEEEKKE